MIVRPVAVAFVIRLSKRENGLVASHPAFHPSLTASSGGVRVRRRLRSGVDPHKPEFAYAANSVSLMMPYAEPHFIKAAHHFLPELEPELRQRTKDYIRQETQHHVEHKRFNKMVGEVCRRSMASSA